MNLGKHVATFGGAATAAASTAAHNADAGAHGAYPYQPVVSAIKTGSPIDQISLGAVFDKSTASVTAISLPAISKITGYNPIGVTPLGDLMILANDASKKIRLSSDGFVTFREIQLAIGPSVIWFDSAWNAYAAAGNSVYRSVAGEWDFVKIFDWSDAQGTATQYSFATDPNGGVFVAEYTLDTSTAGKEFWRSIDYGVTWTSSTIDYGQRHFHGCHYNKDTSRLFLLAGEPIAGDLDATHGRKLLVSDDRGATWSVAYSFGDSASSAVYGNPVAVISDDSGRLLLGADGGSFGGLFSVLPEFATEPPGAIEVRHETWRTASSAYVFAIAKDTYGNLIIPPEKNAVSTTKVVPLTVLPNGGNSTAAIMSPYSTRQTYTAVIYGPDSSGNFAIRSSDLNTLILPAIEAKGRTTYVSSRKSGVVGVFSFDLAPSVVAGATLGGAPVMTSPATIVTSPDNIPVTPGKSYRIVWAVKRANSDVTTNLLREILWYNGESHVSTVQAYLRMSKVKRNSGYQRVVSHVFTAPDGVDNMRCRFIQTSDTENPYYCSCRMVVYDVALSGDGDLPWEISATDSSTSYSVPMDGIVVDRVYSRGTPLLIKKDTFHELASSGNASVGVMALTTDSQGDFRIVVRVGGVDVYSGIGALWGSRIGGVVLPLETNANECLVMNGLAAPLVIGFSTGSVGVLNPETGAWSEFSANTGATAIFGGNVCHVPVAFHGVTKSLEDAARNHP